MRIALQMDPPDELNYKKDSTFVIALEAQKRGHDLFYYNAQSLALKGGILSAAIAPVQFSRNEGSHYKLGNVSRETLLSFDMILMRNDFNDPLSYNAAAHLLDHVSQKVLILNDPKGVRESPEKMLITHYPELAPKTLITRDLEQIREFFEDEGDIIIKPLNGFGGNDIHHVKNADDLARVYEEMSAQHTEPFVIQEFLPAVSEGDKRIIVVEGEPIAALNRIPKDENSRANLAQGGKAAKAEITDREREICKILKSELIKRGLVFVGLDVIGGKVTEINPKSPTGLQQIYEFDGIKCEEAIWDAFEKRYEDFRRNK